MFVTTEEFDRDFQVDNLSEHITQFSLIAIRGLTALDSPTNEKPIQVG
jgi:hypothetical protein